MRKIAIVGFAESSRMMAPFDNPEFEIWGLNDLYSIIPHASNITRWFELHDRRVLENYTPRGGGKSHIDHLRELKCPVYMQKKFEDIPNSVAYPLDEIIGLYGDYFTNSVSYMIALAITEGCDELHIYGVDMAHDTEYGDQRPSCEYFLGIAVGKGIQVHIPEQSDLLRAAYLYAYQSPQENQMRKKAIGRQAELHRRLGTAEGEIMKFLINHGRYDLVKSYNVLLGALDDTQYFARWFK